MGYFIGFFIFITGLLIKHEQIGAAAICGLMAVVFTIIDSADRIIEAIKNR